MTHRKHRGSVAIVGGGITGMEAALCLARAGYGVHLIERSDSLGGTVAALHRFYPICACCKVDPRIAACYRDPRIDVMLNTTVHGASGQLGDFTVTVTRGTDEDVIRTGALILAAGIEPFDPAGFDTYSYGTHPNVVTSLEYEALMKSAAPAGGVLKRPSDGMEPRTIAWIQCVGSRDINHCDAPYCSSVCCMYALKEAVTTKDLDEDIDTSIFFMDMRTHGKGYEDYLNSAVARGVTLVRSRIHTIDPVPSGGDLAITYADESGSLHKETFHMVVLSVGLRPARAAVNLARTLGIPLKDDDYLLTEPFRPAATAVPGVFVCGGVTSPADISRSIIDSAAAVSEIASVLEPGPAAPAPAYPPRSDAAGDEPRVLFAYELCSSMDAALGARMEEYALRLPGVVSAARSDGDAAGSLSEHLKASGADRLVFACCTPASHTTLLEEALKRAGLNPSLYETVDIGVPGASDLPVRVRDEIRMGVSRSLLASPPPLTDIPVVKSALVVGGGVAGLESASALARGGYPVTLVEKGKELGGHARHVAATRDGDDVPGYLASLTASVERNDLITVMTDTRVTESRGCAGSFTTSLLQGATPSQVHHGVTVVATGGEPFIPAEYLYGGHPRILLWSELSSRMMEDPAPFVNARAAVFIQCVGSRQPDRPHCSNLCCTFTARAAVDLKTRNPRMDVYVLYREMRTFGERERLYKEARDKGVLFIRYEPEAKPEVRAEPGRYTVTVTVYDPILERPVAVEADFVSLQTAIESPANGEMARIFGLQLDSNGFVKESPEKLKPMHSTIPGVYCAGLAHYPKDLPDSIAHARAAAASALEILATDTIRSGGVIAHVNPEKCAVCCTCVRTCPFHVPRIDHDRGAAVIDPSMCQGCGMCVAECPGKAIEMALCSDTMLNKAPSVLFAES